MRRNLHIYKRDALDLTFITTVLARTPMAALELANVPAGKYVVLGANFDEVATATVTRPVRVVTD